ncbi:MAG: exodeoxyribonuclease beta chain [Chlamydiota bacterium]|jgi:exodeoxyribonuclease V beta subunit
MEFDVLKATWNPLQSYFLEASAGTGKTFAIEHIVIRLILEGIPLEKILVVTFTRAATRELKYRIHANLKTVQQELKSGCLTIDYLQTVVKEEALAKIEAALSLYEKAAVYTIHGFCFRMLKAFAFEAGVSYPEQEEESARVDKIVEKWIERVLTRADLPYRASQLNRLLKSHRKDPQALIAFLKQHLLSCDEVAQVPSYAEYLQEFNRELSLFPKLAKEAVEADLLYLSEHYTKIDKKGLNEQIALWADIISSKACTEKQFDRLLEEESLLENMIPSQLKKRGPSLDYSRLHFSLLLEKMQALVPFLEGAGDPGLISLHLLGYLKEESLLLFNQIWTPDRLLVEMQAALPLLKEKITSRFSAAIIDEFQDTDAIQWSIIHTLFEDSILYLVGDPKQSIYGFRNADLNVYRQAKQKIPKTAHLNTNYRSSVLLVDALNALFERVRPALEVKAVQPGAKTESLEDPLVCFLASEKRGRSRKFPSHSLLHSKVYPYMAHEILHLHKKHHIPFHEMAILIKDRFQGQEIVNFFKLCKIPVNLERGALITTTEAYASLKEVVRAAKYPEEISYIKTALATPLLGWDAALLSLPSTHPLVLKAKGQFKQLHYILEKGFGSFFYKLLSFSWGENRLSLVEEKQGEEIYEHLQKILEIVLAGFDFEELETDATLDNPLFQVASAEEKGAVSLMTIHRSKGLEFPIVFALGLCGRPKESALITLNKKLSCFEEEDERCQKAIQEFDAERIRLFYVALTRAKKRVYLPLLLEEDHQGRSPAELFLSLLLPHASWTERNVIEALLPLNYRIDCLQEMQPPFYEPPVLPTPTKKNPLPQFIPRPLVSFTSLAESSSHSFVETPKEHSILSMPKGADTGILIHHLMEEILKKGLHHPFSLEKVARLCDKELKDTVLQPWLSLIPTWIQRLFEKQIDGFCLKDVKEMLYETEFLYPCQKGLMKGFADLFFSFKDKYYILDWKTNALKDYTEESMKQAIEENNYTLQAKIYKEALKGYVKLFDTRPFDTCFGGAIYYFVRGEAFYVISC